MRFVRNAKIFRGQMEVAPVAGVFFLLALLLLLHSAFTFTPGITMHLGALGAGTNAAPVLRLNMDGAAFFRGNELRLKKLGETWLEQTRKGEAPSLVWLATEPGTPTNVLAEAMRIASEAGVILQPLGTRLELPEAAELPGTTNSSLVVAVNLNSQVFFENQLIDLEALRQKFLNARRQAQGPLTLIVQGDRGVEYGRVIELSVMARDAGFEEVLLATRPPPSPKLAPPDSGSPP